MILDNSFPREIKSVQEKNIPLVIVGGTVEYHGPHCSYGCDTLVAEGLVELLAKEKDLMIAPKISIIQKLLIYSFCGVAHFCGQ